MSGSTSEVLALIPARGGSKGIARKNLLPLAGKPLLAYSILHGLASHRINRVIVSTDDPEIADVARDWGAEAPFMRPPEYADDHSPDIDVFRHALGWLRQHESYDPDLVVHLRPPGPVRRVELIDQAVDLLLANPEVDAVRSVSPAIQTPFKMWFISPEGFLRPALSLEGTADCQSQPRQHLPAVYWQNGYVDVLRPRAVFELNSMWGARALPLVIEEPIVELDYPEDVPHVEDALRRLESSLEPAKRTPPRHAV